MLLNKFVNLKLIKQKKRLSSLYMRAMSERVAAFNCAALHN